MLDSLVARFVEHSPVAVMAQLGLERVLDPVWVDELFEAHRGRQYQRQLLFSTTVDIVALVALGMRPSVHAAARARKDLGVSLSALYEKINHTEPQLGRALVEQSARRLEPIVQQLRQSEAPVCPGYRVRIVDGNCLAPSEKRLKPLRSVRSAALPGRSLVVYDPDTSLVVDVLPCEDGHAGERTLMAALIPTAQRGELWIADRNFCTYNIMATWQPSGCAFVVREHSTNAKLTAVGPAIEQGQSDTGVVFEHLVDCHGPDGSLLRLRRIQVQLDKPTEDGDTVVNLLANLPADVTASQIAALYRRRWTIENMFQKLESVLASEVRTLGYPRAALFSFCVAVLAYNVLSMLQAAVQAEHRIEPRSHAELSLFLLGAEVKAVHAGMMIAIPSDQWTAYRELALDAFCSLLLQIAKHADPTAFRKSVRGPKNLKPRERIPPALAGDHKSTARLLKGRPARTP
jgi:IS4 transposase